MNKQQDLIESGLEERKTEIYFLLFLSFENRDINLHYNKEQFFCSGYNKEHLLPHDLSNITQSIYNVITSTNIIKRQ